MGEQIRIADLREPVLTDLQRQAVEYGETLDIELSEDALLSAAVAATGLDDFGPDDFHERLQLWLAEIDDDPNRSGLGRATTFNIALRGAKARLRVYDFLRQHPEIHDVEIKSPIIVVGLPRTGTTHLLNLISADSRLRSLPLWESYEPVPVPGEEPGPDGLDARFARSEQEWHSTYALMPIVAAMHAMTPEHIHEENELQAPAFSHYTPEWTARVPQWRDYYLAHDQTPHYEFLKTMLKLCQWQRGPERWVLKSPQHLEQLGPLMTTFPDATIVMTHRDPVSVVQSAATMLTYGARLGYYSTDPDFYIDYWTDRVERLLSAAVRDLHFVPDDQRIDVPFDEFMADDVAMVERIYDLAGMTMTGTARAQMDAHMATHPRDKYGRIVFDLRGDFGVEPEEVRERFKVYIDRFAVPIEVK